MDVRPGTTRKDSTADDCFDAVDPVGAELLVDMAKYRMAEFD